MDEETYIYFTENNEEFKKLDSELKKATDAKYLYSDNSILHEDEINFIQSISKERYSEYLKLCKTVTDLENEINLLFEKHFPEYYGD